ncbi:MAG TPA: hypothetical protein VMR02_09910 [Terracidiphilus sp.]|nr:hypothetical protein [Terracidiphilus sp.]
MRLRSVRGPRMLYGALLAYHGNACTKLRTVWLLTALTRASVATFVIAQVLVNTLEAGWLTASRLRTEPAS